MIAYLNDDLDRKWPTRDLALRLFGDDREAAGDLRSALEAGGRLFASGALELIDPSGDRLSWLARSFRPAPHLAAFVMDQEPAAPIGPGISSQRPVRSWESVPVSAAAGGRLRRLAARLGTRLAAQLPGATPTLFVEGRRGSGRWAALEAIGSALATELVRVEPARALEGTAPGVLARRLRLHQRLTGCLLAVDASDSTPGSASDPASGLAAADERGAALRLIRELGEGPGPLIVLVEPESPTPRATRLRRCLILSVATGDYEERKRAWKAELAAREAKLAEASLDTLADRFVLTVGDIADAVSEAAEQAAIESRAHPGAAELFAAARARTGGEIGRLARKVESSQGWDDLVLPEATQRRLLEIVASVQLRRRVFSEWGFGARRGGGAGVKVLFAGSSGTGKTLTAGVIARDLSLDLYRIDLSSVVSKYIGETEKNLDRIFRAAQWSNAILFFDEADALFGKRSEVKDAHDRYANIEVAYLLQKMEDYDGMAILATNLSRNLDPAFSRRMHHVVEFPYPDTELRERLWRVLFPAATPVDEGVDFGFLARQFPMAGGDIENVALSSAFLAAADGGRVTMEHVIRAVEHQILKQGKVPSPADFKQYHRVLSAQA